MLKPFGFALSLNRHIVYWGNLPQLCWLHWAHRAILTNIYIEPNYPTGLFVFQRVTNVRASSISSKHHSLPGTARILPVPQRAAGSRWPARRGDTAVRGPPSLTQVRKPKGKMSEVSVERSDAALFHRGHPRNTLVCLLETHSCTSLGVYTPCVNRQGPTLPSPAGPVPFPLKPLGSWATWGQAWGLGLGTSPLGAVQGGERSQGTRVAPSRGGQSSRTLPCHGSLPLGWLWKFSFFTSLISFVVTQVWGKQKVVAGDISHNTIFYTDLEAVFKALL